MLNSIGCQFEMECINSVSMALFMSVQNDNNLSFHCLRETQFFESLFHRNAHSKFNKWLKEYLTPNVGTEKALSSAVCFYFLLKLV